MARSSVTYLSLEKDYLVLEFEYNSKVISTKDSSFLRIKNTTTQSISYISYLEGDNVKPLKLTGNTLGTNIQNTFSGEEFVALDTDRPIKAFETSNVNLTFEKPTFTREVNVTYNKVRFHLLTGYNFEDLDGFITKVAYLDDNGNYIFVSNFGFLKGGDVQYSLKPLVLADKIYDRYIEFYFPSFNDLIVVDESIPFEDKTKAYLYYFKGSFPDIKSTKIVISFAEVIRTYTNERGQLTLSTVEGIGSSSSNMIVRELNLVDIYDNLYGVVQDSTAGDYFEIFPAYDGEFLENFLLEQRKLYNKEFTILNTIQTWGHIEDGQGLLDIKLDEFTFIQSEGFDKPYKYRPIIDQPNIVAISIDYMLKLYEKNSPTYILKKASFTYNQPRKYGAKLQKLDINTTLLPIKIVNKIQSEDHNLNGKKYLLPKVVVPPGINPGTGTPTNTNTNYTQNKENLQYIVTDYSNIVVNSNTLLVDKNGNIINLDTITPETTNHIKDSKTVMGQNDCVIYLSELDNFVRFSIYKKQNDAVVPYMEDFKNTFNNKMAILFYGSENEMLKVYPFVDTLLTLPANVFTKDGVLFKIDSSIANKILSNTKKEFKIISESYDNEGKKISEIVIYTGKYSHIRNMPPIKDQLVRTGIIDKKLEELNKKLSELEKSKSELGQIEAKIKAETSGTSQKDVLNKIADQFTNLINSQLSSSGKSNIDSTLLDSAKNGNSNNRSFGKEDTATGLKADTSGKTNYVIDGKNTGPTETGKKTDTMV